MLSCRRMRGSIRFCFRLNAGVSALCPQREAAEIAHALRAPAALLGAAFLGQIDAETRGAAKEFDHPYVREILQAFDNALAQTGNRNEQRDDDDEEKDER